MSLTRDITPTIQWQQPSVPREPLEPLLQHVLWILRGWRPNEFDHYGNEAYWALEELSLKLIDCESDRRGVTDLLSESLTMNLEQDQRADRQRDIIASLRERLRDQPKAAA